MINPYDVLIDILQYKTHYIVNTISYNVLHYELVLNVKHFNWIHNKKSYNSKRPDKKSTPEKFFNFFFNFNPIFTPLSPIWFLLFITKLGLVISFNLIPQMIFLNFSTIPPNRFYKFTTSVLGRMSQKKSKLLFWN